MLQEKAVINVQTIIILHKLTIHVRFAQLSVKSVNYNQELIR